jgi:hypothetical protein
VVMQGQGLSTVDTLVPTVATTVSSLSYLGRGTVLQRNLYLGI